MVGYNLTGMAQNSTSIVTFVQEINSGLMLGWFGTLFLVAIGIIVFMAFLVSTRNDVNKSIAAACFICFGLSILLAAINLIPNLVLYITVICTALAVAFTWRGQ